MKSLYFKRSYWLLVFFPLILVHSCVTEDPEPGELPSLITLTASEITSNSAMAEGSVSGLNIVSRGIVFNTAGDPNLENDAQVKTAGEGEGSFQAELTGLEANTEYFFKAFASNSEGTAYGSERAFTTLAGIPTVVMDSVKALSPSSIIAYAHVIGDAADSKGIVIGNSNTVTLSDGEKYGESGGDGSLEITIDNLTDETIYFVKAYAISSFGETYSEALEVETLAIPFEVTISTIDEITASSANINAEVEGQDVLMKGVLYGTNETLSFEQNQFSENGAGQGSFVATLGELIDATDYFAQAYAYTAEDTTYSAIAAFTTDRFPLVASAAVASNITSNSFSVEASVEGSRIEEAGFVYSTTESPDLLNANKVVSENIDGGITAEFLDLRSNTEYFVRSYVTSDIDTAYSESLTVLTEAALASVTTAEVSDITFTSATSGGEVTGDLIDQKGLVWSTNEGPTLEDSKTENGPGNGNFTAELSELTTKTTYYVRAYAINAAGTVYGNELSFTTEVQKSLPTVTSRSITEVALTTATGGGEVISDGNAAITARGMVWSTSSNPTVALSTKTANGTGTGAFTSSLTGLSSNTTYFVRAYATNDVGTAYGNELSFTTEVQKSLPTVTSRSITEIAFTTATGGGEVTSDGNAAITARGMVWSTSSNPTVALSTKTANGTGTGTFTSSLTGLSSNTTYFVRAYATNSEGTAYGNEASFTTEIETSIPSVSTSSITNVDLTTATGGGEVTSDGNATITARGVVWSTSSNPTVALSTKTVNGTSTGSFTSSLTGLSSNTRYYYRAYATNSEGTAYGNERSFITNIAVGTLFRGGMVAYVFVSGDIGYVAGQNHGIIVTLNDQSTGTTKSTANSLANNLSTNGYSDWSLPSSEDASNICSNKNVLNNALNNNGGSSLVGTEYWTKDFSFAGSEPWPLLINFGNCSFLADDIGNLTARVRSIRKF